VRSMSQIYNSLMKAENERKRASNEKPLSQIFEPEKNKMEGDIVINSPQEKIETLKVVEGLGEKGFSDEQSTRTLSLFFFKLANSIKTNLGVIQTLAELSQGKFKDQEFENNFIETVNEYIHGTNSGLDCFFDYLKIRSPIRKKNTVHTILEEILDGNEKKFRDRKIQIVKKQFEKDLPETSVPDDHLRYILNWVVQYTSSSISSNGNIGFLTRSLDFKEVKDDSQSFPKRDRKYIEVIIFFMAREEVNEAPETKLGTKAFVRENDFIFPLVEEIIRMNRGIIKVKVDHKKHWTQISLFLPVL
jgi:hypothetical protein